MKLLAFACALGVVAAYAAPEDDILAGISTTRMMDHIKYLSGATSNIKSRYSPDADTVIAQNWLAAQFQALGYTVFVQDWGKWNGYNCADNVIARKVGTKYPGEYYVIGGHYDSTSQSPWSNAPGADDNATGTVSVLEAAILLKDYPSEYSIEFIAFCGEEQGLLGSTYYCNNPAGRFWKGAIILDMTGYETTPGTPMYVGATTNSQFANWLRDVGVEVNPGRAISRFTYASGASDNYPFYQKGVPEALIIEGTPSMIWGGSNPYYHSTSDTWDKITPSFLEVGARMGIAGLVRKAIVYNGDAAVLMSEYSGNRANVTVEVQRRNPGSTTPLETYYVQLDSAGVFRIPDAVPAGTWDFAVKAPGWLRDVKGSVSIPNAAGISFTLVPGDANDSNSVDMSDLNAILTVFGDAGTAHTDIDGSGAVDLADLTLVLSHFGEVGDL